VGLNGRSVLVTGAHGLLGSWLVRALLQRGARVVVIRRDEPAVDSLKLQGLSHEVSVVNGDICAEGLVGRALGEYGVEAVFHLAAQTLVGTANEDPVPTFETNIRGTWLLLERLPPARSRRRDRRLLGQGIRSPGPAALRRGSCAGADLPLRRLQGGRRPDRSVLLAHGSRCRLP